MTTLDVGCGANPRGDVNLDYYIEDIGHRTGRTDIKGAKIRNVAKFVQWDLNRLPLPFADDTFTEVLCDNVIEHVKNPYLLLKEMVRVSSDKVTVICPHKLGERATLRRNPFHLSYFNVSWFYQAARQIGVNYVKVSKSAYCGFPLSFLPLEITVEIRK